MGCFSWVKNMFYLRHSAAVSRIMLYCIMLSRHATALTPTSRGSNGLELTNISLMWHPQKELFDIGRGVKLKNMIHEGSEVPPFEWGIGCPLWVEGMFYLRHGATVSNIMLSRDPIVLTTKGRQTPGARTFIMYYGVLRLWIQFTRKEKCPDNVYL